MKLKLCDCRRYLVIALTIPLAVGAGCARKGPIVPENYTDIAAPRNTLETTRVAPPEPDYRALGKTLVDQKHYEVARVQLVHALEKNARDPETLYLIGVCERELHRPEMSLKYFEKALAEDHEYAAAYNGRGLSLITMGKTENARTAFRKAVTIDPAQPNFHNNLGMVYMRLNLYLLAEQSFRKSLAIDAAYETARNNLAICLGSQAKDIEAADILMNGGISPDRVFSNMGAICHHRHDYFAAAKMYAKALAINPKLTVAAEYLRQIRRYHPELSPLADEPFPPEPKEVFEK